MNGKRVVVGRCLIGLGMMWLATSIQPTVATTAIWRGLPSRSEHDLLGRQLPCTFGALDHRLSLQEAIERALCANPQTRSAWTLIEQRTAAVGISKAAYLPSVSATGHWLHDNTVTDVRDHPTLSTNYSTMVHSDNLSLSWVLYDFGERSARLADAKALLNAAQASRNAVLQKVFAETAKTYYKAQAAQERLRTDAAIVADAHTGLEAAQRRVAHGVAPDTEVYQARTAYEQAKITQTRDRGRALVTQGTLANAIALAPDTPLTLNALNESASPVAAFADRVDKLMAKAERIHPTVLAAEQELLAAKKGVIEAKAQGRPTIKLVGQYSRDDKPVQLGLGSPHYPATGHDGYVGIQVNIPIFSGFSTTYQVRQAEAKVDQQSVALDNARQQVALKVWTSYQTLQTATQNMISSARLQNVAMQAWKSAQRRYRSGVGTILELLNTQRVLAQARLQRLDASVEWRYDRLALASALGRLSWRDIRDRSR